MIIEIDILGCHSGISLSTPLIGISFPGRDTILLYTGYGELGVDEHQTQRGGQSGVKTMTHIMKYFHTHSA